MHKILVAAIVQNLRIHRVYHQNIVTKSADRDKQSVLISKPQAHSPFSFPIFPDPRSENLKLD